MIPANKSDSPFSTPAEMIPNFNHLYSAATPYNDFSNQRPCFGVSDTSLCNMLNAPSPSQITNNTPKANSELDPRLYSLLSPEQINLLKKFELVQKSPNTERARECSLISGYK